MMSDIVDPQSHGGMMPAIQQKDTTFTKIFVGGLPYHTTDKSLRQFFEAFGDIEEAVVITDRQTGKSRGYGFVTMADRDAAERAVKDANPIIDGRKANVNLAYLGAKPRINAQNGFPSPLRASFPLVIPSQYGLPPHYVYPSAYLPTPGLILPGPHAPLSPAAAAASPFYEYAAYPPQYSNGLDPTAYPPFAGAGHPSAAGGALPPYLSPAAAATYAYALQAPPPQSLAGAAAHFAAMPYATSPASAAQPHDARLQ